MFSAFLPGHMHAYILLYLHEYNRRFSWEHFILAGSELCGGSAACECRGQPVCVNPVTTIDGLQLLAANSALYLTAVSNHRRF